MEKPQEDVTDNLGLDETLISCVDTRALKLSNNNKNESVLDTDTDTNNNSIALADTFMSHDVHSSVSCNDNVVESPVRGHVKFKKSKNPRKTRIRQTKPTHPPIHFFNFFWKRLEIGVPTRD